MKIGNRECDTRVVASQGLYHGELLRDGKLFDGTGAVKTSAEVEEMLVEMIKMYRKALKQDSAFGNWVRDEFL